PGVQPVTSGVSSLTLAQPAANYSVSCDNCGSVTLTGSTAPFQITSWSLSGTNLTVCWQSIAGDTYSLLTNSSVLSYNGGNPWSVGDATCNPPGPFTAS